VRSTVGHGCFSSARSETSRPSASQAVGLALRTGSNPARSRDAAGSKRHGVLPVAARAARKCAESLMATHDKLARPRHSISLRSLAARAANRAPDQEHRAHAHRPLVHQPVLAGVGLELKGGA
jgi:hypothetical protein